MGPSLSVIILTESVYISIDNNNIVCGSIDRISIYISIDNNNIVCGSMWVDTLRVG